MLEIHRKISSATGGLTKWALPCCLLLFALFSMGNLSGCTESVNGEQPLPEPQPYPLNEAIPSYFSDNVPIPPDNPTTVQGVALGRRLFYEKKLSGDNTQSCASCHQQEKAFTDGERFSLGIRGQRGIKNAMSLTNLLWQNRFFWNGRSESLEEQALIPIEDPLEMDEDLDRAVEELQADPAYPPLFEAAFGSPEVTAEGIGKALAQFQRTLISADSRYDQYLRGEYQPSSLELQGIELFFTHPIPEIGLRGGNCGDCHLGPLTSGALNGFNGFHNNGLEAESSLSEGLAAVTQNSFDRGKFKAPTLRNIALTAPYMHDGRFQTLEDVLDHYNDHIKRSSTLDPLIIEASNEIRPMDAPIKLKLTDREKEAILAFLNMLTDEAFVTDERFSNPFEN